MAWMTHILLIFLTQKNKFSDISFASMVIFFFSILRFFKIETNSFVLGDSSENLSITIKLLSNTFSKDPTSNTNEALELLYKQLRAGDAPTIDIAKKFIEKMFFSTKKYDLGAVGRYRINKKFGIDAPTSEPVLTKQDFIEVFKYLIMMRNNEIC